MDRIEIKHIPNIGLDIPNIVKSYEITYDELISNGNDIILYRNTDFTIFEKELIESSYTDFPHTVGYDYLVSVSGITSFVDVMDMRNEIVSRIESIAGTGYTSFSALTQEEKNCAFMYCTNRIKDTQGIMFLVVELGGDTTLLSNYMNNFFNMSTNSRSSRYVNLVSYVYENLNKEDALRAEEEIINLGLIYKFKERGIIWNNIDGVNGIGDWLDGNFRTNLNNSIYTLTNGSLTIDIFITNCLSIIENGKVV